MSWKVDTQIDADNQSAGTVTATWYADTDTQFAAPLYSYARRVTVSNQNDIDLFLSEAKGALSDWKVAQSAASSVNTSIQTSINK